MGQFMNDNACFEISISVRCRSVPQIHAATTILTIGWSHKVGIVVTAAVLSIRNDGIILSTTTTEVVLLEVAGDFVKAISKHSVSQAFKMRDIARRELTGNKGHGPD